VFTLRSIFGILGFLCLRLNRDFGALHLGIPVTPSSLFGSGFFFLFLSRSTAVFFAFPGALTSFPFPPSNTEVYVFFVIETHQGSFFLRLHRLPSYFGFRLFAFRSLHPLGAWCLCTFFFAVPCFYPQTVTFYILIGFSFAATNPFFDDTFSFSPFSFFPVARSVWRLPTPFFLTVVSMFFFLAFYGLPIAFETILMNDNFFH